MTRLIILLILVASLPVLPFIYKKAGTGRRWKRFYLCMAMQEKKRKGFVLVMDALILSVNFLMFRISGPDLWLVPGFVVALLAGGCDSLQEKPATAPMMTRLSIVAGKRLLSMTLAVSSGERQANEQNI